MSSTGSRLAASPRWQAWRRWIADPVTAACTALVVLLVMALGLLALNMTRSALESTEELTLLERDHLSRAMVRTVERARAAMAVVVRSTSWSIAQATLARSMARLEAEGHELPAMLEESVSPAAQPGNSLSAPSAAADFRWALIELDDALAPLLAATAIDKLQVVRQLDGKILYDSTTVGPSGEAADMRYGALLAPMVDGIREGAGASLGESGGGLLLLAADTRDNGLLLVADVNLGSVTRDTDSRLCLFDGQGQIRAWQHGQPVPVGDEAMRLARQEPLDPAAMTSGRAAPVQADLELAGVPLTMLVDLQLDQKPALRIRIMRAGLLLGLAALLLGFALWRGLRRPLGDEASADDTTAFPGATAADGRRAFDEAAAAIMRAVGQIAADRDLTIRLPADDEITGAISEAINVLTEEAGRVFAEAAAEAGEVAQASTAVRVQGQHAAEALGHELREVDLAAQELGAAARALTRVAELARRVDRNAALAVAANQAAAGGVERTCEGIVRAHELISDTEKQVRRLGERSREIGQVVTLIRSISERTGILALNASMRAAGQGDPAADFGPIADEIKRLSGSAGESTERIAHLVTAIQDDTAGTIAAMTAAIAQVVEVTQLSGRAGEQMDNSRDRTRQLAIAIRSIAKTTGRQARASAALQSRAARIRTSSAQTAEALQAQAAETEQLASSAQRLVETLTVFKVENREES